MDHISCGPFVPPWGRRGEKTQRSEEPVSTCRFKVCPPMVTGVRYSLSFDVGVMISSPELLAVTSSCTGVALPYLRYTLARADGPCRTAGSLDFCCKEKLPEC